MLETEKNMSENPRVLGCDSPRLCNISAARSRTVWRINRGEIHLHWGTVCTDQAEQRRGAEQEGEH